MAHSTRPFWVGLDPDKPEPLDKVLAALHCYQVAPPGRHGSFYFEFTIDSKDHHRLADGFPELQKLAAFINKEIPFAFDPSTGKLATMSPQKSLTALKYSTQHVIATGLESISHLPAPIGPLARNMWQEDGPDDDDDHLTVFSEANTATSTIIFTATNEHLGPGKLAYYVTEHPALRTITVVQLALPMKLETDRQVRRLTKHSHVSVFVVGRPVTAVVQRESLSTPDGAIKFWFSDFVKQDDAKCLPDELTRPLHNENRPANMTISYAAILSKLRRRYELGLINMDGSAYMSGGNGLKADGSGGGNNNGGKRSFSTLAAGNTAHKRFGGGGKRPLSTIPALAGYHEAKGNNNMLGNVGGSRVLSGRNVYQLPTESTVFCRFTHMTKPAEATILAPWARLLARLPRKW